MEPKTFLLWSLVAVFFGIFIYESYRGKRLRAIWEATTPAQEKLRLKRENERKGKRILATLSLAISLIVTGTASYMESIANGKPTLFGWNYLRREIISGIVDPEGAWRNLEQQQQGLNAHLQK